MRVRDGALAVWTTTVAVFLASTAFTQWPGLHHDSALYTTPIVKSAALGLWQFDSYMPGLVRFGSTTFDLHGQLYQFVFGRILHASSYIALFRWTAVLNLVTYAAYFTLGWRLFRTGHTRTAGWLASGVASVAALACLYLQGRPEQLLPIVLLIPFALREWSRTAPWARRAAYVVLGLSVVTSPLPGVLFLLGVLAWITLRVSEQYVVEVSRAGLWSLGAALLTLGVACPANPWQWADKTIWLGSGIINVGVSTIWSLGVFQSAALLEVPLWNLFLLGAFAALAFSLIRRGRWVVTVCYALLFVVFVSRLAIYSFFAFLPLVMLALAGPDAVLLDLPDRWRRNLVVLTGVFGAIGSAGVVRAILLAVLFARGGVSFDATRHDVQRLASTMTPERERIGFAWLSRPSFVVFSEPKRFLITVSLDGQGDDQNGLLEDYERQCQCSVSYLLYPQVGHLTDPPATVNGGAFVLEHDGWTHRRATLFGIKLGGAMPGYQYALYRRRTVKPASEGDR